MFEVLVHAAQLQPEGEIPAWAIVVGWIGLAAGSYLYLRRKR